MARSLASMAALVTPKCQKTDPSSCSIGLQSLQVSEIDVSGYKLQRRAVVWGLAGAVLGMSTGERSANAAGRRPPPPPPKEKTDPSLSGVQAKVLASKKRKEALKEGVAKLRQKGKAIDEPPS